MRRQFLQVAGLTLTVLSAVAVAATAQERQPRPPAQPQDRERAFSWSVGPDAFNLQYLVQRRGRLGILVDLTPDAARDSVGARVAGVTPGGPADRADVHTGDIVVRITGHGWPPSRRGVTRPTSGRGPGCGSSRSPRASTRRTRCAWSCGVTIAPSLSRSRPASPMRT